MASDIKEAIRRLIYEYVSKGADEVIATQEAVAASTTKTDKASLSLEKAFGSLERRYVDTVRFQQDYAKVQDKVNAAVAQNPELQERANTLLAEAGKHFDSLASKGNFFSEIMVKGFTKFLGPMALVNLALTGVGAAIGYMAAQWQSSSTTVAQALEEQNRLMAESKKLIDGRTSAQEKMFAQSQDVLTFQNLMNENNIRVKINENLQETLRLTERVASTPTQVPGEMGEAPTGFAPLPDPGFDKITEAAQQLQATLAQGLPGYQAYVDALGRIGTAYPAIQQTVQELMKLGLEGLKLEQGKQKSEAMAAALKGVATAAQLAALGLQTVNQNSVNQRGLGEAAANAERMADHVMRLRELYPGVTQEVAKQLELQQAQLGVAQARTPAEQQIAQEKLRQVQLTQQGIVGEEQQLILAGERAISEENIAKQKEAQNLAINNAANAQAMAQADTTASVSYTGSALSDVGDQIRVNTGYARNFTKETSNWSRNVEATTSSLEGMGMSMQAAFYAHLGTLGYLAGQNEEERMIESKLASGDLSGYVGQQDISSPAAASASLANILRLGVRDGLGNVNRLIDAVTDPGTQASLVQQAIDYIQRTQPANLAREEMINDLNGKLEGLINSTDSLNSTMQNALSPFYSQDPRTTHLGFRAGVVGNPEWQVGGASNANPLAAILGPGATAPGMADGGSFVVGGGYSANDNKIAAFPVASGEQVTVNRNRAGAKGGQVIHIDNRTIINGRVDADVFAQMKVSKYQQAQRMRSGLGAVA